MMSARDMTSTSLIQVFNNWMTMISAPCTPFHIQSTKRHPALPPALLPTPYHTLSHQGASVHTPHSHYTSSDGALICTFHPTLTWRTGMRLPRAITAALLALASLSSRR